MSLYLLDLSESFLTDLQESNSRRPSPDLVNKQVTNKNGKVFFLQRKIGEGGFGVVYSAKDESDKTFVVKFEPESGALRHELYVYRSLCSQEALSSFKTKYDLAEVNFLHPRGDGKLEELDFIILDQCEGSVDTAGKVDPEDLKKIAMDMLYTLEYMHQQNILHNDIKPANILRKEGEFYLADFGLASRYQREGVHKDYDYSGGGHFRGTPVYAARNAFSGNLSRASDLEGLAYTLLELVTGSLPWGNDLNSEKEKIEWFQNLPLTSTEIPACLKNFFKFVKNLGFAEDPDYNRARSFFSN